MRSDLNISSVIKRVSEKADTNIVNDMFEQQAQRVDQIEKTFLKMIDEMELLNQ